MWYAEYFHFRLKFLTKRSKWNHKCVYLNFDGASMTHLDLIFSRTIANISQYQSKMVTLAYAAGDYQPIAIALTGMITAASGDVSYFIAQRIINTS